MVSSGWHIPVILVSANNHNLANSEKYGATGIMEKPFNFPRLIELIETNTIRA
jgi:hypothetical protein